MKRLYGLVSVLSVGYILIPTAIGSVGCKNQEPECIPGPPRKVVVEEEPFVLPRRPRSVPDKDADHCQVCVMSSGNFLSCQRVWQENDEDRETLRQRAQEKACRDAGYPDDCPAHAIRQILCRGDVPSGDTREATDAIRSRVMTSTRRPATATTEPAATTDQPSSADASPPSTTVPID